MDVEYLDRLADARALGQELVQFKATVRAALPRGAVPPLHKQQEFVDSVEEKVTALRSRIENTQASLKRLQDERNDETMHPPEIEVDPEDHAIADGVKEGLSIAGVLFLVNKDVKTLAISPELERYDQQLRKAEQDNGRLLFKISNLQTNFRAMTETMVGIRTGFDAVRDALGVKRTAEVRETEAVRQQLENMTRRAERAELRTTVEVGETQSVRQQLEAMTRRAEDAEARANAAVKETQAVRARLDVGMRDSKFRRLTKDNAATEIELKNALLDSENEIALLHKFIQAKSKGQNIAVDGWELALDEDRMLIISASSPGRVHVPRPEDLEIGLEDIRFVLKVSFSPELQRSFSWDPITQGKEIIAVRRLLRNVSTRFG